MSEKKINLDFNRLYANADFQRLGLLLNRFNFFEVTDIQEWEVKHTKFLSYLLNPNESHGLGTSFLQNFLWLSSSQLQNFPDTYDLDLPYADIQPERQVVKPDLSGTNPKKNEKGSLDVFMRIPNRQSYNSIVLVIENKINANEAKHEDGTQLERYRKWLEAEFKCQKFYLYLTKRGDAPSDEIWGAINYAEHIVPAIQYTLDQHAGKISAYVEQLLRDYQLLFSEYSDSGEQDEYVRKICEVHPWVNLPQNKSDIEKNKGYVRHKSSFDLLMKYSDDKRYDLVKDFKSLAIHSSPIVCKSNVILYEDYILIPGYAMRPRFDFSVIKKNLVSEAVLLVDSENKTGIESQAPFYFQVYFDREADLGNKYSCMFKLILGPMKDQVTRQKLLENLLAEFEGNKVRRRVGATNWTTICTSPKYADEMDPKKWFEKHCFKPISPESPDVSLLLADWVIRANNALENLTNGLKQNP